MTRSFIFIVFIAAIQKVCSGVYYRIDIFPKPAVIGEDIHIICNTTATFLTFEQVDPFKRVCTIKKGSGENCTISQTCINSYTYMCSENEYTLHINGSLVTDTLHGIKWKCSDPFGPSGSVIEQLYINVPITSITITSESIETDNVWIGIGLNRTFACETDAGRPSSKIQWYLGSSNLTTAANDQTDRCEDSCTNFNHKNISSSILTYTGDLNDDGENLYCTASNIKGEMLVKSQNVTINVYSKMHIVPHGNHYEGTSLLLECIILSFDNIASWSSEDFRNRECLPDGRCLNNNDINHRVYSNSTGVYVNIKALTIPEEDNRNWTCSFGRIMKHYIVSIKIPLQDISLTPNTTVNVTVGQRLEFKCSARSRPISTLSWHISETSSLAAQSPPHNAKLGDTITSTLFYTAQEQDNNQTLFCTANNGETVVAVGVLLNIISANNQAYTNKTELGCVYFSFDLNIQNDAITIEKDGYAVFQAFDTTESDLILTFGNFTDRITNYTVNRTTGDLDFCITNTTIFDGGDYNYRRTNEITFTKRLYVLDKPKKADISLLENGITGSVSAHLSCKSTSTSVPDDLAMIFYWKVNNTLIAGNSEKYTFWGSFNSDLLIKVEIRDRYSKFSCLAKEMYGQTSATSDEISINPKDLPPDVGETTISADMSTVNNVSVSKETENSNDVIIGVGAGIGSAVFLLVMTGLILFVVTRLRNSEKNLYQTTQSNVSAANPNQNEHMYNELQELEIGSLDQTTADRINLSNTDDYQEPYRTTTSPMNTLYQNVTDGEIKSSEVEYINVKV